MYKRHQDNPKHVSHCNASNTQYDRMTSHFSYNPWHTFLMHHESDPKFLPRSPDQHGGHIMFTEHISYPSWHSIIKTAIHTASISPVYIPHHQFYSWIVFLLKMLLRCNQDIRTFLDYSKVFFVFSSMGLHVGLKLHSVQI